MFDASAALKCVGEATGPMFLVVQGKSGFGKSALAGSMRELLSSRGITVHESVTAVARPGDTMIVDDAQNLPEDHLLLLHGLAERTDLTLVVFTEPRTYVPALRSLRALAGMRDGVLDLPGLDKVQIIERARTRGLTIPPALAASIAASTNGSASLVDSALRGLAVAETASRHDAEAVVAQSIQAAVTDKLHADAELGPVLLLASLGLALDPSAVASALSVTQESAERQIDTARSSGVMSNSDDVLALAVAPVRDVLGAHRTTALMRDLLESQLRQGQLDTPLASKLAAAGLADPRLADTLIVRAQTAVSHDAVALYDSAILAGASTGDLAAQRAEAFAMIGDLTAAQRCADQVFDTNDAATDDDLRTAVRVSATIAAEHGMLGRSAELYRWLGVTHSLGADAPLAATVMVAAGLLDLAQSTMSASSTGPPTSASASAALLATGVIESVTQSAAVALNSLSRAAALSGQGRPRAVPDTAPAITALLAIHSGDLGRAQSVLTRSDASNTRYETLLAWTTMLRGDLTETQRRIDALDSAVANQRDLLFVHALRVGLARRVGDTGSLVHAWNCAQDVLAEYTVDLFSLLPLGELWVAAVRLGETDRVEHLVDQARTLLTDLGEPPNWASAFHWYGVQAAILAEKPVDLLPHAKMLAVAAESNAYAAGLATAGRVWVDVLKGLPDAGEVESAARTLDRIGLPWDGARLASEAALRVSDTKTATSLLQVARSLRPTPVVDQVRPTPDLRGALSEREAEVAELLILGMTYKEVGARLYISAKTVEHHVSRIRRRIGAGSRSELMSMLRSMGYGTAE